MKKSTPVIMGVLLILGIVALGYLADLESSANNTTNNTTNYSFFKHNNLTGQTQTSPLDQTQQTSDTTSSDSNGNTQNTTGNATSQNVTASSSG